MATFYPTGAAVSGAARCRIDPPVKSVVDSASMSVAAQDSDASRLPSGREASRRHTEHGRERKQQLVDAAAELFAANGYAATRIQDICRRAGVAKGLFYWYFPTKEELFAELVRTMRQRLRKAQAAAMDPDADPLTRIRQGTEASVRFNVDHAGYFSLLDVERGDASHAALLREGSEVYLRDVVALIRDAQRGRADRRPATRPRRSPTGCSAPCRRSRSRGARAASTCPPTTSPASSAPGSSAPSAAPGPELR